MRDAATRGFGGKFPDDSFWDITGGKRPSLMADAKSVHIRQTTAPFAEDPATAQWPQHGARLALSSMGTDAKDAAVRHGAIASTALGFLNGQSVGVYDAVSGQFWPDAAQAVPALQQLAQAGPQVLRK